MDVDRAESPPPRRRLGHLLRLFPIWTWLSLAGLFGGIAGLGGFTFTYAKGFSYLSNDPRACVNCHVMRDVFDGWNHGSHKAVAACNDCHVPHNPLVAKYAVKAVDGFKHSAAFTLGGFPEPIRITAFDRAIVQHNCVSCHGDMVSMIDHSTGPDPTDCLHCHSDVGHLQ
jgi:cytochrome c nitrite reductase small subunit